MASRVIDVLDSLDALRRSAEDRSGGIGPVLMESVITRLGLPPEILLLLRSQDPAHLLWRRGDESFRRLTLGSVIVLRAADTAERNGADPEVSCSRAVDALSRYLYIAPRNEAHLSSPFAGRLGTRRPAERSMKVGR